MSTKIVLTRVVLHLDLEEDVDNGVGQFDLGVWNELFGSKFVRRHLPHIPRHYDAASLPAHISPRVVDGESSVHAAQIQRGQNQEEAQERTPR